MSKFNWKEEHVVYLIDEVKKNLFVWDQNNLDYKSKCKKQLFWINFVKNFNEDFAKNHELLTYGEAVKKWGNLKSYFMTEKQRQIIAKKSGAGAQDVENESSWRFFKLLEFLHKTAETMPSVNNFNKRSLKVLMDNDKENLSSEEQFPPDEDCFISQVLTFDGPNTQSPPFNFTSAISNGSSSNIEITSNKIIAPCATECTSSSTSQPNSSNKIQNSITASHAKKAIRTTKKAKTGEEILAESCLRTSEQLSLHLKQKSTNHTFADYIAMEIDRLDDDLQNRAKYKISSILFELNELQIDRNTINNENNKK